MTVQKYIQENMDRTLRQNVKDDGVWLMKILDAIYGSAKSGHEVQI